MLAREDIAEFHYIAHHKNLPSIVGNGIMCHDAASDYNPVSVALPRVQDRRAPKVVPQGGRLHSYANLYFTARNPMLSLLRDQHADLAVIKVSPEILDIPGVIISDGNAASGPTAFYSSPDGLENVDPDLIFAEWWNDDDYWEYVHKKRVKCAEVLVPEFADASYIQGLIVSCKESMTAVKKMRLGLPVELDPNLFFLE